MTFQLDITYNLEIKALVFFTRLHLRRGDSLEGKFYQYYYKQPPKHKKGFRTDYIICPKPFTIGFPVRNSARLLASPNLQPPSRLIIIKQ